jgi:hypothetical protein
MRVRYIVHVSVMSIWRIAKQDEQLLVGAYSPHYSYQLSRFRDGASLLAGSSNETI